VIALGRGEELLKSCAALAVLLGVLCTSACGGGKSTRLVPIGEGLQGRSGLKATLYASGLPLMSAFAFDAQGPLWVTASGATTHGTDGVFMVAAPGKTPVRVVSGTRGPLGLVWVGGKLIVSSLGRVTAFGDLRGTHFATRKTIVDGPVADGENNNVILAPDGRLVMGVSASCDHCVPSSKWSGSIVTFRPDGGGLQLFAARIRAAYGLAYYPDTDDLFASMNQRDDLGAATPVDWLAQVRRGQNWGFPDCYGQKTAACKLFPTPVAVLDAHAAAGGVAFLNGAALVSEWQLGKVQRVVLTKNGSGYTGVVEPYLTGLKNPLPLLATANGELLVGDWGTGKIYRVAQG
jgi:glucose/arabinose dehydrogenase